MENQLKACGVEYFEFYLMYAQGVDTYGFFRQCKAYETALELQAEGKFRDFGIIFHDTASVLEQILTEYPQIEIVQIQFNYADYDDPIVQSRECLEVCRKFNKPVIVMEPVKGGNLANLPEDAKAVFDAGSPASYAIRFAAGFEEVLMVLSGMSDMEQMNDNLNFMKDFTPLTDKEHEAVQQVRDFFESKHMIPCTACRYCLEECPQDIFIPDLLACMNAKQVFHNWNTDYYYSEVYTKGHGKASDCIQCRSCEDACPQHLPIRDLLVDVAREFEKQ